MLQKVAERTLGNARPGPARSEAGDGAGGGARLLVRPNFPTSIIVMAFPALFGVLAMSVAGITAFSQVTGIFQAVASAILIEVGMITESIFLMRKNWMAIPPLVISLVVSITYNFIQVERAGAALAIPLTDGWQLVTLAVGPISSLFFLALAIGFEYTRYENALAGYKATSAVMRREESLRAEQQHESVRIAQENQRRADELAREEREREERLRLEAMRLEAENKVSLARIRAEQRARESANGTTSGTLRAIGRASGTSGTIASASEAPGVPDGTFAAYAAANAARNGAGEMECKEIMAQFGVSRRTAYRFIERYEKLKSGRVENLS